ncbi:hypothetical protein HYALB_00000441 [Hymenoscyphus albidus]|uniref:IEC3 subunit of the Ino80 complex, chromatin re-modelling-domain-containing protein n=1 Tax=Hymenoscyphus albidus TaxID=595503 RepID=A0A9N9LLR9_9HELO|nr:hypothetical protein HYALB_00000441 [Hymenoscyphus albidus]
MTDPSSKPQLAERIGTNTGIRPNMVVWAIPVTAVDTNRLVANTLNEPARNVGLSQVPMRGNPSATHHSPEGLISTTHINFNSRRISTVSTIADVSMDSGSGSSDVAEFTNNSSSASGSRELIKNPRKKFRKLRIVFDEKMRLSNDLYEREQKLEALIKKLALENDQILDLLLDINDSPQIPAEKRFDLSTDAPGVPSLHAVPPLVSHEDITKAAELDTPAGQAIYKEIRKMLDEKTAATAAAHNVGKPPKPLCILEGTIPHLSTSSQQLPKDFLETLEVPEGHSVPLTYTTPDQIDDYHFDIDASLGTAPPAPHPNPPPNQDLALRNPNSVYNWLRKNEPKVFLQDNEGSEKSLGKPGALRGAGKRASMPAPSKPDALEFVEEDGIGYDPSVAGQQATIKGKRKREEGDDTPYHGKAGKVDDSGTKPRVKRAYNRRKKPKNGDAETPVKPEKKKGGRKAKEKLSSPPPGQHPFGPM